MEQDRLEKLVKDSGSNFIVHNAIKSKLVKANQEDIQAVMKQNIESTQNVLEIAREQNCKVLLIHRFSHSDLHQAHALGVANQTCSLLADSYRKLYNVDVRQVHLPALLHSVISHQAIQNDFPSVAIHEALD